MGVCFKSSPTGPAESREQGGLLGAPNIQATGQPPWVPRSRDNLRYCDGWRHRAGQAQRTGNSKPEKEAAPAQEAIPPRSQQSWGSASWSLDGLQALGAPWLDTPTIRHHDKSRHPWDRHLGRPTLTVLQPNDSATILPRHRLPPYEPRPPCAPTHPTSTESEHIRVKLGSPEPLASAKPTNSDLTSLLIGRVAELSN